MTLAESILAGSLLTHPERGVFLHENNLGETYGCALGMAAMANGFNSNDFNLSKFDNVVWQWQYNFLQHLRDIFPVLDAKVNKVNVPCGCGYSLYSANDPTLGNCIEHLFDYHVCPPVNNVIPDWTLEQLADWVGQQEIEFKKKNTSAVNEEIQEKEQEEVLV